MSTDPDDPTYDDTLTHTELVLGARAIQNVDRDLPQGPLLTVRRALQFLGWHIHPPTSS
jgi:hypothetical protein